MQVYLRGVWAVCMRDCLCQSRMVAQPLPL